ncbi:MAG: Gfo/Idh/MocA family oxidoreductase [Victivallaceae bacterium]|nr:Gfo/Idh/MocA family oxidoreductase [Victivallaceae bacterium]
MKNLFGTDRRIKLGIWGLGRGANFIKAAQVLHIDVVAGCDLQPDAREEFRKVCPNAQITSDEDAFLAIPEMDAVLIATFFPSHTGHTIKALQAGKHVMCEVSSFFTPAEGVALVEAVQASNKVYNLLENYPFTKENMYLRDLWSQGFFGDFMYGEFEYLHNCRSLCYGYNRYPYTPPLDDGDTVHSWRSWLNFHYYNTHSLGPLMKITGLRPEAVSALPEEVALPGFPPGSGMSKACPSMIRMSNGGLMRNLTGATTCDYHMGKRIWGTRAAAESLNGDLKIQIGASGNGLKMEMQPQWPELAEYADATGHGGGDFWELYYFAREVLTGEPAPWGIYDACDVTLAGIMAARSQSQGGALLEIPDFRDSKVRDRYRNDHWKEEHFDPRKMFPENSDKSRTGEFCRLILALESDAVLLRKAFDGLKLWEHLKDDSGKLAVLKCIDAAIEKLPEWEQHRREAQSLAALYPDAPAAAALRSMMELEEPEFAQSMETLRKTLRENQKKIAEI